MPPRPTMRETEANIAEPAKAAQLAAHRQDAALVVEDGLKDVGDGQSDGVIGGSFSLDDLIGGIADIAEDAIFVRSSDAAMAVDGPLAKWNRADGGAGPERDLRVAVFAGDVGMDILDSNASDGR